MHTKFNKALVAIAGAGVFLLTTFGFEVTPEMQEGINTAIAVLTPVLVYLVPNKED